MKQDQIKMSFILGMLEIAQHVAELNGDYTPIIEAEYRVTLTGEKSFNVDFIYISDVISTPNMVDDSGVVESEFDENIVKDTFQTFSDYTNTKQVYERFSDILEEMSVEYYTNTNKK